MARLSMNELTTLRWSFEQDVTHYKAAGYEAISVWREKLADYGEEKGIELLHETGLNVSALLWAGGFTGSDGRRHTEAIDDGIEAIHTAAALKAGCLMVHSGSRAGHTQNHARRLLRSALRSMLDIAETLNITLAIEPMHVNCAAGWTFMTNFQDSVNFIRSFQSPNLKIAFDCYHWGQDAEVLECIPQFIQDIALVQLGDTRRLPLSEQNRCRLGEGNIPLPKLVSTLLESGYEGDFDVELLGEDLESSSYDEILTHSRDTFDELIGSSHRS
jgi:sugar phosphate isomerase/epimerase